MTTISARQVIALIAAIQQCEPERVGSAMRRLRRRSVPFAAGGNGRGRPAAYGPKDIVRLTVAFELMAAGVTPDRTVGAMEEGRDVVSRAVAAMMANRAGEDSLLALDGSIVSCSPAVVRQWAKGRGSTRSAVLINTGRIVDDLRDAVADTMGRDAAAVLDALDAWAGTIMMTPGNASDPDPL